MNNNSRKSLRILCVGGGTGGHVTPIVAIIDELRELAKTPLDIRVWVDKKFFPQARDLLDENIRVDVIASGKFRRYANLKWWYKYFSWYHISRTHAPNFVDFFKIIGGFFQSFAKLIRWRPDAIFCKGGFVCLPVGVAAHLLKIPLVIHDSDTVPGLANRILAKFANAIGTGSPVENYPNYSRKITQFVGIPVRPEIHKFNKNEKIFAKQKLGLNGDKKLIFAFGGGGGATEINKAVAKIAEKIVAKNSVQILLGTGKGKMSDVKIPPQIAQNFRAQEFFTDNLPQIIGAADVIITRAGATSMAEFAAVAAPVIIIPSPYLAGDHQTKNAEVYAKNDAAVVLKQTDVAENSDVLLNAILSILNDEKLREKLSQNLAKFAKPDALEQMAKMILGAAKS